MWAMLFLWDQFSNTLLEEFVIVVDFSLALSVVAYGDREISFWGPILGLSYVGYTWILLHQIWWLFG